MSRKNQIVWSQAPRIFDFVLQALDADTLQGQTAERVLASTKVLLASSAIPPQQLLASIPVERHAAAQRWFSS